MVRFKTIKFCWAKVVLFFSVMATVCVSFSPDVKAEGDILRIEFSELARMLPWEEAPGALNYRGVKLYARGTDIRPGERWIEVIAKFDTQSADSENTRLLARVQDKYSETILAEKTMDVFTPHALIKTNMRALDSENARLRIEWTDSSGGILGIGELWLSALPVKSLETGLRVPVSIDIPEGLTLVENYPVRFGLPLPEGVLWKAEGLKVVDAAGREMPSQLEAAGRWAEDGAVKWMWIDTLVSDSRDIFVEVGERTAGSSPANPVKVEKNLNGFTVSTGKAVYSLGYDGALIKEVMVNGNIVAGEGDGRGLYVIDQKGRLGMASAEGVCVKLESEGPVSAVIRIEGMYATEEGEELARHITRFHFYAGRPEVEAVHTLVLTRDTNEVWFRDIGWEFKTFPGTEQTALFGVSGKSFQEFVDVPVKRDQNYSILQKEGVVLGLQPVNIPGWNLPDPRTGWQPFLYGDNRFVISAGEDIVREGEDMGDWAAIKGRDSGFLISCRDAAAQHPKEFVISEGRIDFKFFSSSGGKELDFRMEAIMKNWGMFPPEKVFRFNEIPRDVLEERLNVMLQHPSNASGWAKTHHMMISPLTMQVEPYLQSGLHSRQVFAHVSPQWIRETEVIGPLHPFDKENFPEAEALVEGLFRVHYERWNCGPEGGFIHYHAGPHRIVHDYRTGGYSLRSDGWYLYARSGQRFYREFAQGANRSWLDGNIAHWNVPHKNRGLFITSPSCRGTRAERTRIADLPMHWQGRGGRYELSTVANMDQALLDYYITGYRRAGDIMENFAQAVKENLTLEQSHWRALLSVRHIAQAYELTWEPEIRGLIYGIIDRHMYDPESDVLLTKARPYRSSTYKTETDSDSLLNLWKLFHDPLFYRMAKTIGMFNLDKHTAILTGRNTGFVGHFLWEETGDSSIASMFDYAMRTLISERLVDLESKTVRLTCTSQVPKYFKGLPLAMDIMVRNEPLDKPPSSWLAFNAGEKPVNVFILKPGETVSPGHYGALGKEETAVEIMVRKRWNAASLLIHEAAGGSVILKPRSILAGRIWVGHDLHNIEEQSVGAVNVRIPKDAPGGVYELVIKGIEGEDYAVFANGLLPLSIHAPYGWTPQAMNPPLRTYFRVPENVKGRIFFEKGAVLFTPSGETFNNGEYLKGWVDLPEDNPGLWSYESVDTGKVETENLPPFFSMGCSSLYAEYPHE